MTSFYRTSGAGELLDNDLAHPFRNCLPRDDSRWTKTNVKPVRIGLPQRTIYSEAENLKSLFALKTTKIDFKTFLFWGREVKDAGGFLPASCRSPRALD